ncbi:hypothetical protein [Streptomyces monashensis]|uniref:Uncharacterized protein n=1 Tax=Streptomyces monashensis TaxID=1678012 RepID=A0A1S2QRZ2_9ACTN|nr:hypothetical protein [Streptomyces monashensis]OIK08205.1 hypothetical protein BIV23_00205 [Streptomyces monashensis]
MVVTLGSLLVGLVLLCTKIVRASSGGGGAPAKGAKATARRALSFVKLNWRALMPFFSSTALFALAGGTAGGFLGTVLGWFRGKIGAIGDWIIIHVFGQSTVSGSGHGGHGLLTPFGGAVMIVLFALMVTCWKSLPAVWKQDLRWGVPTGITLGPFVNGVFLVAAANWAGAHTIGWVFSHGVG